MSIAEQAKESYELELRDGLAFVGVGAAIFRYWRVDCFVSK